MLSAFRDYKGKQEPSERQQLEDLFVIQHETLLLAQKVPFSQPARPCQLPDCRHEPVNKTALPYTGGPSHAQQEGTPTSAKHPLDHVRGRVTLGFHHRNRTRDGP